MGNPIQWIVLFLGLIVLISLVAGWRLSLLFTGRSYLQDTSSPSEDGLSFNRVTFQTMDGLELKGWYIPQGRSNRTVILLHGHGGSMDPDIHHATYLHKAGYNVLMFDFRAHGRSPGKVCSFGYLESRDALAAIDFASQRGARWIALMGFSMGGMTAIAAASRTAELKAIVVDGSPARFSTMLIAWGKEHRIPLWFSYYLAGWVIAISSLRIGVNLTRQEPVRLIRKINPNLLMLIHGEDDQYCPDFDDLADASRGATIWREAGVGHVQLSSKKPVLYQRQVTRFFKEHW